MENYTEELTRLSILTLDTGDVILDVGSGELTTITSIVNKYRPFQRLYTLDMSISRLIMGKRFWEQNLTNSSIEMKQVCVEIGRLPMSDNSVDLIISAHALEPNGHNLENTLSEILRVSRKKCVLFEPCYEMSPKKVQERMDKLGYIKGIESTILKFSGKLMDIIPIKNLQNELNPIACYVIEPVNVQNKGSSAEYTIPGTNYGLTKSSIIGETLKLVFDFSRNKFNSHPAP